jgi:hypothetical protein
MEYNLSELPPIGHYTVNSDVFGERPNNLLWADDMDRNRYQWTGIMHTLHLYGPRRRGVLLLRTSEHLPVL